MPQSEKCQIVLIHGFPLDRRVWDACARSLSTQATCHALDLPGFGANNLTALTMADFAEYVAGYIHETIGGPTFVAGLSMGGYVVLELLAMRPELVRGVVLVDTKIVADNETQKTNRNRMIDAARSGPAAIVSEMLPNMTAPGMADRDPEGWQTLQTIMQTVTSKTMMASLAAMRDRQDHTQTIARTKVPVLAVVGALDAITPPACADQVLAANAAAQKIVISGAGHMAPLEAPQAVAAAISGWVDTVARK